MTEKQFEKLVERELDKREIDRLGNPKHHDPRGYWIKRWGGSKFVPAGLPDLQIVIGCFNVDVELKTERGVVSELQKQKIEQIKESGGYAIVLRPSGLDKFLKFVDLLIMNNSAIRSDGYYVEL